MPPANECTVSGESSGPSDVLSPDARRQMVARAITEGYRTQAAIAEHLRLPLRIVMNTIASPRFRFPILACPECGSDYQPTRLRHLYCSEACRSAAETRAHGHKVREAAAQRERDALARDALRRQQIAAVIAEGVVDVAVIAARLDLTVPIVYQAMRHADFAFHPRLCATCGAPFPPKTLRSRYCSHECRSEAYKAGRVCSPRVSYKIEARRAARREAIARLIAEGAHTVSDIARRLGISRQAVHPIVTAASFVFPTIPCGICGEPFVPQTVRQKICSQHSRLRHHGGDQ